MRKTISLMLLLVMLVGTLCFPAAADRGDKIRFVPVEITITASKAVVEGYFVNMNDDVSVGNFRNVEMDVYYNDKEVLSGTFGDINQFMIEPLSVVYQSFIFNGDHGLEEGTFECDDDCFTVCAFSFSTNGSSSGSSGSFDSSSSSAVVPDTSSYLNGNWQSVRIEGENTHAFVFSTPQRSVRQFQLDMEVEMNYGARCKEWQLWGRSNGQYVRLCNLHLDNGYGELSQVIYLPNAMNLDAIAITPKANGSYSWTISVGVTGVVTN